MGKNIFGNCKKTNNNLFTHLILCLSIFSFNIKIFAQEVAPLKVDNFWVYDSGDEIFSKKTITNDSISIDSIEYFEVLIGSNHTTLQYSRYMRLNENGYYVVRLDTSYPALNHEQLYYKKNAIIGDTWENPGEFFPIVYTVVDTMRINVFGQMVTVKRIDIDESLFYFIELWTDEFGVLSRSQHPLPWTMYTLKGCAIDGVAYGDTSFVVGVEDDFQPINDFILEQNYPNPFNPVTKIKFHIGTPPSSSPLLKGRTEEGFVTLIVYDILGNEIKTLVREEKPPGTYEFEFRAENLPSGVYIYRLTAGEFSDSKKLLLLK